MKEFWTTIQLIFTAVGGWLGWFLGGAGSSAAVTACSTRFWHS